MTAPRSRGSFAACLLVVLLIFALNCRDGALGTNTTTPGFPYYGGYSSTTTGAPYYYGSSCGWNCNTSTTTGNDFDSYTGTTTGAPYHDSSEFDSSAHFGWGSNVATYGSTRSPLVGLTRSPLFGSTTSPLFGSNRYSSSEDRDFGEYGGRGTTTTTSTMNPPPKSRYSTSLLEVIEPTPAEKLRCLFTYSVGDITNGRRSVLVQGDTAVEVHSGDTVEIVSTSADQRPPATGVFSRFMRKVGDLFLGSEERYTYMFSMPPGCMHVRSDPVAVASDIRGDSDLVDGAVTSSSSGSWGDGITGVAIRLSPEVFVRYARSQDTPPLFPEMLHYGINEFATFEHCLFGMEVEREAHVDDLILLASPRTAAVDFMDRYTGMRSRVATLSIPCFCRPSNMELISWWVGQGPRGYPVVTMYVGFSGFTRVGGCYSETIRKGRFDDLSEWPISFTELPYFSQ